MRAYPPSRWLLLLLFLLLAAPASTGEHDAVYQQHYQALNLKSRPLRELRARFDRQDQERSSVLDFRAAVETPRAYNDQVKSFLAQVAELKKATTDATAAIATLRAGQNAEKDESEALGEFSSPLHELKLVVNSLDTVSFKYHEQAIRGLARGIADLALDKIRYGKVKEEDASSLLSVSIGETRVQLFANATMVRNGRLQSIKGDFERMKADLESYGATGGFDGNPDYYLRSRRDFIRDLDGALEKTDLVMGMLAFFKSAGLSRDNAAANTSKKPLETLLDEMGWDDKKSVTEAIGSLQAGASGLPAGSRGEELERTRARALEVIAMLEKGERGRRNPDAQTMGELTQLRKLLSKKTDVPAPPSGSAPNAAAPSKEEAELKSALAMVLARLPGVPRDSPLSRWALREATLAKLEREASAAGAKFHRGKAKDQKGAERDGLWTEIPDVGKVFDSGDGLHIEEKGAVRSLEDSSDGTSQQELAGTVHFTLKRDETGRRAGVFKGRPFVVEAGEKAQINREESGAIVGVIIFRKPAKEDAGPVVRHALYANREEIHASNGKVFAVKALSGERTLAFNVDPTGRKPFIEDGGVDGLLDEIPDDVMSADRRKLVERYLVSNVSPGAGRATRGVEGWQLKGLMASPDKLQIAATDPNGQSMFFIVNLKDGLQDEKITPEYRRVMSRLVGSTTLRESCKGYAGFPDDYYRVHALSGASYRGFTDVHKKLDATLYLGETVRTGQGIHRNKTQKQKSFYFDRWSGNDLFTCSLMEWTEEEIGIALPAIIHTGLEYLFLPFQSAFYSLVGGIKGGVWGLIPVGAESEAHAFYTKMQSTLAKKLSTAPPGQEAEVLYSTMLDELKIPRDPEATKRKLAEFEAGLDELVKDKRKELWGDFMAGQMGEIKREEREAFLYENAGLGNAPGYYFRYGQKQIQAGNTWTGAGYYALGGGILIGEGFATGLMFGEVAGAVRLLGAAKYSGYSGNSAQILARSKALQTAKASAAELEMFEKTGKVVDRLQKLKITAEDMRIFRLARDLGKAEAAAMGGVMLAETGLSGAEFISSVRKGDTDAAWAHFNEFFSLGTNYAGLFAGATAKLSRASASKFVEWMRKPKEDALARPRVADPPGPRPAGDAATPVVAEHPRPIVEGMEPGNTRVTVGEGASGNYLEVRVDPPEMLSQLPEAARSRMQRKFHITVVSAEELSAALASADPKVKARAERIAKGLDIPGRPEGRGYLPETEMMAVDWPEAQALRAELGLKPKKLHISLTTGGVAKKKAKVAAAGPDDAEQPDPFRLREKLAEPEAFQRGLEKTSAELPPIAQVPDPAHPGKTKPDHTARAEGVARLAQQQLGLDKPPKVEFAGDPKNEFMDAYRVTADGKEWTFKIFKNNDYAEGQAHTVPDALRGLGAGKKLGEVGLRTQDGNLIRGGQNFKNGDIGILLEDPHPGTGKKAPEKWALGELPDGPYHERDPLSRRVSNERFAIRHDEIDRLYREATADPKKFERDHPHVPIERLKYAKEGYPKPGGTRVPLNFPTVDSFFEFRRELLAACEGYDAVVQEVGSGTTGWRGNPNKRIRAYQAGSDADFAVFSRTALKQAMDSGVPINDKIVMDGKYTVLKNGPPGFYATPLGRRLQALALRWNDILYKDDPEYQKAKKEGTLNTFDGLDFKMNLSLEPFEGAISVIEPPALTQRRALTRPGHGPGAPAGPPRRWSSESDALSVVPGDSQKTQTAVVHVAENLPPTSVTVEGNTFLSKTKEVHVTVLGAGAKDALLAKLRAKKGAGAEQFLAEQMDSAAARVQFKIKPKGEYLLVEKGGKKSIIEMVDMDGLDAYYRRLETGLGVGPIERPPPHVTWFTEGRSDGGIGINTEAELRAMAKPISSPAVDRYAKSAWTP